MRAPPEAAAWLFRRSFRHFGRLEKFFGKGLTNESFCDIIQNISCEEDTQRVANVHREPTVGASR